MATARQGVAEEKEDRDAARDDLNLETGGEGGNVAGFDSSDQATTGAGGAVDVSNGMRGIQVLLIERASISSA